MQDTQLLADFMEKFGKRLNEEEKTLGDELFMWLTQAIQSAEAREREQILAWVNKNSYVTVDGDYVINVDHMTQSLTAKESK